MGDFPDWTVPTNIQNPQIDVNVVGGEINANITNAEIDTVIKESKVVLDIGDARTRAGQYSLGEEAWEVEYFDTINYDIAKIIPHGANGHISSISFRVKNEGTEDATFTVYLKTSVEGPVIKEVTITVPAGADGIYGESVNMWWAWDFIVIYIPNPNNPNLKFGWRTSAPVDTLFKYASGWSVGARSIWVMLDVMTKSKFGVQIGGSVSAILHGFDYTNRINVPVRVTEDGKLLAVLG